MSDHTWRERWWMFQDGFRERAKRARYLLIPGSEYRDRFREGYTIGYEALSLDRPAPKPPRKTSRLPTDPRVKKPFAIGFLNGYLDAYARGYRGRHGGPFRSAHDDFPPTAEILFRDLLHWAEAERTGVGVAEATEALRLMAFLFFEPR